MPLRVTGIQEGSLSARAGIRAGDQIVSVNGHEIADELELRFRAAEGLLDLVIYRPGEGIFGKSIVLEEGIELGLGVEDFRAKACNNKCIFCFVDQLPQGVRKTLKFKDDDFRLSFLHGNYLTLTNLSDADLARIIDQRLSPLYVSVHATNPEIRAKMLGRTVAHSSLEPMLKLLAGGITVHAQVVLCPSINDGYYLEKTIRDLAAHYPGIASIAIVPLGTSQYRGNLPNLTEVTPPYCTQVIRQVHALQDELRNRMGVTFAYLADEFYIQAGLRLPERSYYDGFALLEDGIGMLRHFHGEFHRGVRRRWPMPHGGPDGTLVTGKLFRPFLEGYAKRIERRHGGRLRVVEVENQFMGPKITVAGLLAGKDILNALADRDLGRFVVIPGECLARNAAVLLDNMSLDQLSAEAGVEVRQASRSVEGFFQALCGYSSGRRVWRQSRQHSRSSM